MTVLSISSVDMSIMVAVGGVSHESQDELNFSSCPSVLHIVSA